MRSALLDSPKVWFKFGSASLIQNSSDPGKHARSSEPFKTIFTVNVNFFSFKQMAFSIETSLLSGQSCDSLVSYRVSQTLYYSHKTMFQKRAILPCGSKMANLSLRPLSGSSADSQRSPILEIRTDEVINLAEGPLSNLSRFSNQLSLWPLR